MSAARYVYKQTVIDNPDRFGITGAAIYEIFVGGSFAHLDERAYPRITAPGLNGIMLRQATNRLRLAPLPSGAYVRTMDAVTAGGSIVAPNGATTRLASCWASSLFPEDTPISVLDKDTGIYYRIHQNHLPALRTVYDIRVISPTEIQISLKAEQHDAPKSETEPVAVNQNPRTEASLWG
jgi:hypothetical protein